MTARTIAFALTLGTKDGVYLAGGIARRYPDLLKSSRFRSAFESKGRYRSLMERIPTQLILHDQPGLLGAAYGVGQRLHLAVDLVPARLEPRVGAALALLVDACVLAFAGLVLVVGGGALVGLTASLGQTSPALGWPMAACNSPIWR